MVGCGRLIAGPCGLLIPLCGCGKDKAKQPPPKPPAQRQRSIAVGSQRKPPDQVRRATTRPKAQERANREDIPALVKALTQGSKQERGRASRTLR